MTAVELSREPERVIIRLMLTPGSATDLFLGDLTRRGYSKRTVDTYRRLLYKLCERLPNDIDVSEITTDHLRRYLDQWNGHANGTRTHGFAVLSSFFDWLVATDRIKRSPLASLARPKRQRPEDLDVVTVSTADVRKLLAAGITWTEKLAVAIPVYIGPRRRAVALLRLRDYDQETGRLRFREKGGKTIWKPIPAELEHLIAAAIADGAVTQPNDYLVPPEGKLQRPDARDDRVIWRVVKRVAARAGVETTVHALRAAFAVFYLEQHPQDTYGLKELLGHNSFETTQVYVRKFDKGLAMEPVRTLSWSEPTPPDFRDEEVYFIAAGDIDIDGTPVKIGYSSDPLGRMALLQTGHHSELRLVLATPGGAELERRLHIVLEPYHLRGEWFAASPELRSAISALADGAFAKEAANQTDASLAEMGAGGFEPPSADTLDTGRPVRQSEALDRRLDKAEQAIPTSKRRPR